MLFACQTYIIKLTKKRGKMSTTVVVKSKLEEYTADARGIAWDTCHKIYILMDDEQISLMREYGYDPLITSDEMTPNEMSEQVAKWYQESCGLKFVEAVYSDERAFVTVVSQFEDLEEEENED